MRRRVLVRVTEDEREILLAKVALPPLLHSVVAAAQLGVRGWGFTLSEQDAAEICDRCIDTLAEIGFDERDRPTKAGLFLESVIDKFLAH